MKKVDEKKTFAYAVAFAFPRSGAIDFRMGNKIYQHTNTVYDNRLVSKGYSTIVVEVCYDYSTMKYVAFNVSDSKVGNKEISIINYK